MKSVEKAAFSATYKTVWCAGPSIEYTKSIESVSTIIERLKEEYKAVVENPELQRGTNIKSGATALKEKEEKKVTRLGFEPRTHTLKVYCSTS